MKYKIIQNLMNKIKINFKINKLYNYNKAIMIMMLPYKMK